jgi:hypothetical protein
MANESFTVLGNWDPLNRSQNNVILFMCVIAAVLHFLLWLQLFIHKTKFDLTFLFAIGYILTDIFLLLFYFIQYSIRIRSWISVTRLSCYFEAYSTFYINLLELYCLAALNICRYWQIARNQNMYIVHRRKLIISCVIVMLLVLINLIIQNIFAWCVVTEEIGSSCSLAYTNIEIRIWNLTIVLVMPILISFYMLIKSLYYLQNINAQQRFMRRNHHRRLIVHSLIFYSVWLTLWLPLMIVTYLDVEAINKSIHFAVLVANTLETLIDPVIVIFLDKRFAHAWKISSVYIKRRFALNTRIQPALVMATVRQTNTKDQTHNK